MPWKPKKPCHYPGCPNLTDSYFCDEHKTEGNRQYDIQRRQEHYERYVKDWPRIRKNYVSTHPFCEMCLKNGVMTPVAEVHHRIPLSQGGTNKADNLVSLCRSCHNKVHIHEIGDRGNS